MKEKTIAVVGATGAVGTEVLKVLEERKFPLKSIKLLASSRSIGKKLPFKGEQILVEELKTDSFKNIDIAIYSAGGSRSKEFAKFSVEEGCVVVDNSSAFRMDPTVPLVVPEINPEDIKWHKGIIANPNCSTIIMVVPIFPIYKASKIKRIVVSTYQAASGAGAAAMQELEEQTKDYLAGKKITPKIFPHQIAFNLFSHNTKIDETGYCEEEVKMVKETQKILHDNDIKVSATTIRIPILRAHSESINLELEKKLSVEEIRNILSKSPGVKVIDDREKNHFPMPIEASGQGDVLVGRIREDYSRENCINLFVSGDQLLKGAALNAVQIAELL